MAVGQRICAVNAVLEDGGAPLAGRKGTCAGLNSEKPHSTCVTACEWQTLSDIISVGGEPVGTPESIDVNMHVLFKFWILKSIDVNM